MLKIHIFLTFENTGVDNSSQAFVWFFHSNTKLGCFNSRSVYLTVLGAASLGPAWSWPWWGPSPHIADNCLLSVSSHAERRVSAVSSFFTKSTDPSLVADLMTSATPNCLPKALQIPSHWDRTSILEFWEEARSLACPFLTPDVQPPKHLQWWSIILFTPVIPVSKTEFS